MKFSNRANARRHERNIHGVIMNPLANMNNSGNQTFVNGAMNLTTTSSSAATPKPSPQLVSLIKKKQQSSTAIETVENWDYDNPQKYRSYLTPAKLSFILQNLEFLEEAQTMTCKCCNRHFPSYKFFMGHMRKKYHNLPRNVCFKCLKHFESKGQFIGHLKRKTCLNLYKIVMNDDSISKEINSNKQGKNAKELLSDKIYACKLCPKKYPLKRDLSNHVFELKEHPEYLKNREEDNLECAYCDKNFEEPSDRKRHYNNLECISYIVCGTCQKQLQNNQQFVDHVYSEHLQKNTRNGAESLFEGNPAEDEDAENLLGAPDEPLSMSKQPQACPVCDKQYNNYYNVLRHMESKHPEQVPRIYECAKCFESFVRQSELRDHVQRAHNMALISGKYTPLGGSGSRTFICRECGETFNDMSSWIEHQVCHNKFMCNQCEYACEDRDEFEEHLGTAHTDDQPKLKMKLYNCKLCSNTYNTAELLKEHMTTEHQDDVESVDDDNGSNMEGDNMSLLYKLYQPQYATGPKHRCRYCQAKFQSKPELQQHMLSEHGSCGRLLACQLCDAEFVNDKGLKVHLWRSHQLREPDYGGFLPQSSEGSSAPIKNKVIVEKEYECEICHIVYKNKDQLRVHTSTVHGFETSANNSVSGANGSFNDTQNDEEDVIMEPIDLPNIWYQCRYCAQSYDTSNDLISHMESHDEDSPQEYTCKECGTIYQSRKDLWAHRYKTHPRNADPCTCEMCQRTFFDKTEIYYHNMHAHTQSDFLALRSGGGLLTSLRDSSSLRQQNFLFGGNNQQTLASQLQQAINGKGGTGANDNNLDGNNSNNSLLHPLMYLREALMANNSKSGDEEFACDMCPKTFNILNALQVHRGWHFRSPDGRKVSKKRKVTF